MNNHRISIPAILIFLSFHSFSQKGPDLIPRKTFFTGEQRSSFKLSPRADIVYFQTTADRSIHFSKTDSPGNFYEIKIPLTSYSWEVADNGLLIASQDSLAGLVKIVPGKPAEKITPPFKTKKLRIINPALHNSFIIDVEAEDTARSGIYSLDFATGTFEKIAEPQPGKTILFDGSMRMIAANRINARETNDILIYNNDNNKWDTLASGKTIEDMFLGGFTKAISVSADGNTVYFTTNLYSDKTKLYAYNTQSKTIGTIAQHPFVDLLPFSFSTDINGNITSVVGLFGKIERVVTDLTAKDDFLYLINNFHGDLSYIGKNNNDSKWLVRELDGGPSKYYLYDRINKKLKYLFSDYPALDKYSLAKRYPKMVITRDGLSLPVHVYLPLNADKNHDGIPPSPLPTVLYVHGGPWLGVTFWNQYFYWRNFQLLANRGYAVIVCEFRGSTGLGKDFVERSYKKWGSDMTNDIVDIAQWAVRQRISQKNKIGIWGWSYGGYAAMAGLAFSPETYACGLSMYGISDLEKFEHTAFASSDYWKLRLGDPENDRTLLHDFSPINSVGKIKAPLLITTGSRDVRVAQSQSDSMAMVIKNAGKTVLYFYYPDEGHDYQKNESWLSFWAISEKFLSKYLGGQYEPEGNDVVNSSVVKVEGGF